MDHDPPQATTPLTPAPDWRWRLLAVIQAAVIVPGNKDEQPTTSPSPPPGWHWTVYALWGPVLIVSGIVLRVLGHAGTGTFLVVIGATILAGYLYMRRHARHVQDVCREVGYCQF